MDDIPSMRSARTLLVVLVVVSSLAITGAADEPTPPTEEWNQTYDSGGSGVFTAIAPAGDGHVLAGWRDNGDNTDGWLVRIDGGGDVRWNRSLGGDGDDRLYGVVPARNGFLVVGESSHPDGPQAWVLAVAPDGTIVEEWTLRHGTGFRAVHDDGNGYVFAGWARGSDGQSALAVRADETGTVDWKQTYSAHNGTKEVFKTIAASDDGFLFAGTSADDDVTRGLAVAAEKNGDPVWSETYGDAAVNKLWTATAVDDGFVLAGESGGDEYDDRDAWLLQVNAEGAVDWERTVGGDGYDWLDATVPTEDGVVLSGGYSDTGSPDGWLVSVDGNGDRVWEHTFGSPGWDKTWPTVRTEDGGFLVAGQSSQGGDGVDGWVVRFGSPGEGTHTPTAEETEPSEAATDTTATTADRTPDETPGSQPGFGAAAAMLAILLALAARKTANR